MNEVTTENEKKKDKAPLFFRWLIFFTMVMGIVWLATRPGVRLDQPGQGFVGQKLPAFRLRDLQGNWKTPADYEHQLKIITFWASWCAPCVMEMPSLDNLYREFKDKGLVVLGVNLEEENALGKIMLFQKNNDITFPILRDSFSELGEVMGVTTSIPVNFVVDQHDVIILEERTIRKWDSSENKAWITSLLTHTHQE